VGGHTINFAPTKRAIAYALGASLFAVDAVTVASAQDGAKSTGIEEVVVYARKKQESLQDVPLSVTVYTSEVIQKLGIQDVRDVAKYTSGIIFDDGFGMNDQRLVIRGLSPSRGRPNSAVLVDGIDLTTQSVSSAGGSLLFDQRLLDIQNIEVVKGPQSALYGRSAFAGALQYITKDPSEELEGNVGLDLGDEQRVSVSGSISGPLSDTFGVRLNGLY
jgi:iron complex outermembrane receptor protein